MNEKQGTANTGVLPEERYVTGRRWLGEDMLTGRYLEHWGTGAKVVRIELPDGEIVSLVAETVSDVEPIEPARTLLARLGVDLAEFTGTHFAGRHEMIPAVEQTSFEPLSGEVEWPSDEDTTVFETVQDTAQDEVEPEPLLFGDEGARLLKAIVAAPSGVRGWLRGLSVVAKSCALTAAVSVLATTGVMWLVTR